VRAYPGGQNGSEEKNGNDDQAGHACFIPKEFFYLVEKGVPILRIRHTSEKADFGRMFRHKKTRLSLAGCEARIVWRHLVTLWGLALSKVCPCYR
jgi:hypothetical protein